MYFTILKKFATLHIMRVCSFSSGSKGNCTYIESDGAKILLDVGVTVKHVLECFVQLDVAPQDVDAIIITHEHSDHIKGVEAFSKKFDTPIFCHEKLFSVLSSQMPSCEKNIRTFKSNFSIGGLEVCPFELSHDSISCFGYRMFDETGSASFVTDTGYLPDYATKVIESSSLVFLEANYDPDMLFACSYPTFLKKRIMSNRGHLSNLDSAKIIEWLSKTGTKVVVLSHISENSNTPYLAYNTIKNYLESHNVVVGQNIKIGINYQNKLNSIYKLTKNK